MTHRHFSTLLLPGVLLSAGILVACQSPAPFTCSIPSGYSVEKAFSHARSDLKHEQCQFQFDGYMDQLLEIAASDPKPENRREFSDLLSWARNVGMLSQIRAAETYRRYFTADFVSMGDQYNNCSSTCRDQPQVIKSLKEELRDKDRGMMKALGDRDGYRQADREYNELLTLIEATCTACRNTQ